jgi:hypothetical protein
VSTWSKLIEYHLPSSASAISLSFSTFMSELTLTLIARALFSDSNGVSEVGAGSGKE